MRKRVPGLLIVAGDGRNSGKTTMCCRVISELKLPGLVAVKITPHFHPPSEGLILTKRSEDYNIFRETNAENNKDSSAMLRAGAEVVYYIQTKDDKTGEAFSRILDIIPEGTPVICESPSLIKYYHPGALLLMKSDIKEDRRDISGIQKEDHREYTFKRLQEEKTLPVKWSGNRWEYS